MARFLFKSTTLRITILAILSLIQPKLIEGKMMQEITFCMNDHVISNTCDNSTMTTLKIIAGKIVDTALLQQMVAADDLNFSSHDIRICTKGIWAHYLYTDYRSPLGVYTDSIQDFCYTCDPNVSPAICLERYSVRSTRFLGHPDMDLPGLSLFAGDGVYGPDLVGQEKFVDGRKIEVSFDTTPVCVNTWAFTTSQNWTVFSGSDFTGDSVCLWTAPGATFGQGSFYNYSYVGSVRLGCQTDVPKINPTRQGWLKNFESCANSFITTQSTTTVGTTTQMYGNPEQGGSNLIQICFGLVLAGVLSLLSFF